MVMAKNIFQRVADEARSPAVLGRYPGIPDYFPEVLLNDLVNSHAWLDLELKRPFLALWVNEADSASPHMISLWMLRKTKIDGMFFLIFHLLG